jgi:hypothetical protein
MKKILVVIILGFLLMIAVYPSIASLQGVEKKSQSFNGTHEGDKKYYFCYIEIEGVFSSQLKTMYWGFPYLTKLFLGDFDDVDSVLKFVFLWNITSPYKDAVISIYQKQGGKLLYEQNDLEQVNICFFTGFYDATYYYATIKGNVFFVEPK